MNRYLNDDEQQQLFGYLQASNRIAITYCKPVFADGQLVDFRYVWANQLAHELALVSPPASAQLTMLQFHPELVEQGIFQRCVQVWQTGETTQFVRSQLIGSVRRWLLLTAEKCDDGLLIRDLDVTEHERQARLLRQIMDHSPAGMALFEPVQDERGQLIDFRYVLTNTANARVTKQSVETMTGGRLLTLFPSLGGGSFFNRLEEVLTTGQPQQYQDYHEGDGIAVWVDAVITRIEGNVLMTFVDITELVGQRDELEAARRAAEEALRMRDVFLTNISHEIRTPLNAVLGFSELLAQELTHPEQLAYAEYIRGAGHTLLKLINNVLDLAKLDANRLELENQPIVLNQVIGSVASILGARARQKGLTFVYDPPKHLPSTVLGDSLRLTQVLTNLCDNAIKFTDEGQIQLAVTVESTSGQTIWLAINVSDTGIGIPADRLSAIFDRFQQVSPTVSRHYGGTGLGLNIVQSLVERMGGHIAVQSQAGQGTTFRLSLPFVLPTPAEPAELTPVADDSALPTGAVTLLLVEDNIFNQRIVEAIVKPMNVTLLTATNGLEALARLRKQSVDLVLMDLQMPLMNGYSTARHIRTTLGLTMPIVALTANALSHEREDYRAWGMNDWLNKPFTRRQLLDLIQQQTHPSASPFPAGPGSGRFPNRLNRTVLADLYGDDWSFVREQADFFQNEWPAYCQQLGESLESQQVQRFRQQVHTFSTTLHSLGMMQAAQALKQLSGQYDQMTPTERADRWSRIIDEIEEGLSELYRLCQSSG